MGKVVRLRLMGMGRRMGQNRKREVGRLKRRN